MKNLTTNEKAVLKEITEDCFYEGLDFQIWADCFVDSCSLPNKEVRGVLSSLVKKDIIYGIEKFDGTIQFTDLGKELMKELGFEE